MRQDISHTWCTFKKLRISFYLHKVRENGRGRDRGTERDGKKRDGENIEQHKGLRLAAAECVFVCLFDCLPYGIEQ